MLKGVKPQPYVASGTRASTSKNHGEANTSQNQNGQIHNRVKRRKNDSEEMEVENNYNITTQNRFHSLSESDGDDEDKEDEKEVEINDSTSAKTDRSVSPKIKIPPIVLYHYIVQHTHALNTLRKSLTEDIDIIYKGDRLIIKSKNKNDYNTILEALNKEELEYHTYTPKSEKELRMVLKNIPPNLTTSEIQEDLQRIGLKPKKVIQMIKKPTADNPTERAYPMFIVTFDNTTTPQEVYKNKKVCMCIVQWEHFKNKSGVTQCYNCQSFGHTATNCNRKPKCVKCAGPHTTAECAKGKIASPKCANCQEDHPASYRQCTVYARQLSLKNQNKQQPAPKTPQPPNIGGSDFPPLPKRSSSPQQTTWTRSSAAQPQDQEENVSLTQMFSEIKDIFSSINVNNIVKVLKSTVSNVIKAPDSISKVVALVEGFLELFNKNG